MDTLEMIAMSYVTTDENEERDWRTFIEEFSKIRPMHELISWQEVTGMFDLWIRQRSSHEMHNET